MQSSGSSQLNLYDSILINTTSDVVMEDNWWKNLPEAKPKATDDNEWTGKFLGRASVQWRNTLCCQVREPLISVGVNVIAVVQWLLFPSLSFLFWKSVFMILFLIYHYVSGGRRLGGQMTCFSEDARESHRWSWWGECISLRGPKLWNECSSQVEHCVASLERGKVCFISRKKDEQKYVSDQGVHCSWGCQLPLWMHSSLFC